MADQSASHGPSSPLHVVRAPESLDELLDELTRVLEALRRCHRDLAETPDPGGPREAEIRGLLDRRAALGSRIGTEIVRVLATGGTIRVTSAERSDTPLPAPPASRSSGLGSGTFRPTEVDPTEEPTAQGDTPLEALLPPPAPPAAPEKVVQPPMDGMLVQTPAPPVRLEREPPAARVGRPALTARPPASESVPEPRAPSTLLPSAAPRARKGRSLRDTLDLLGPPERIEDEEQAVAAVTRLVDACSDLDEWLAHPTEVQRALVGLTSSMARHVQDESEVLDRNATRALGTWFSTMTRWSGLYKPGFVRGLSRMNRPERPTWLADWNAWWELLTERVTLDGDVQGSRFGLLGAVLAESGLVTTPPPPAPPPKAAPKAAPKTAPPPPAVDAPEPPTEGVALRELEQALSRPDGDLDAALKNVLDAGVGQKDPRLVSILADHRERVSSLRGLKTLKSALKFAKAPSKSDPPESQPEPVSAAMPDSWPFYALTRGVNAVVVGGDPRPTERMREAFGFASVTWDPIDPRRVDALAARIRALSVEFVVLLRDFVSHSVADAVISSCKEANVPYVVCDAGYGVGQVRLAIERYLQGRLAQLQA